MLADAPERAVGKTVALVKILSGKSEVVFTDGCRLVAEPDIYGEVVLTFEPAREEEPDGHIE